MRRNRSGQRRAASGSRSLAERCTGKILGLDLTDSEPASEEPDREVKAPA